MGQNMIQRPCVSKVKPALILVQRTAAHADVTLQVFQLTHDLRFREAQEAQMRHAADAFPAHQRGPQLDGPPQRYGGRKYGGGPMGQMDNRPPRRSGPPPSHDSKRRRS